MSATLTKNGSIVLAPTNGAQDGVPAPTIPLTSSMPLVRYEGGSPYDLNSDSPRAVALGACTQINYVHIRVYGGYVLVTLVSTFGTAVIPVEGELEIRSDTIPYTSLTLQRPTGVQVIVHVLIGEKN